MAIKGRIRAWLGLSELIELAPYLPTKEMLNALEVREKQRHESLMGMLNRIEQRMINEHIGQPREFAPAELSWEAVEAMALHNLNNTQPPKEYADV